MEKYLTEISFEIVDGVKKVYTRCERGQWLVEDWDNLSPAMQMVLKSVANPSKCETVVTDRIEDIEID